MGSSPRQGRQDAASAPTRAGLAALSLVTAAGRYPLGGPPIPPEGAGRDWQPPSLATEAMRWTYVLRSRERWRDSAEVREQQQRDAIHTLQAFGLGLDALRQVAVAGPVVVHIPYDDESQGWDARIFPWEFVLARATRPFRDGAPVLTVMRHLDPSPRARRAWPAAFAPGAMARQGLAPRVLFVQSFPGPLTKVYSAGHERERVRHALGMADDDEPRWLELNQPTLQQLHDACQRLRPEIVHLTGCDTHQGLTLLEQHAGGHVIVGIGGERKSASEWLLRRDNVRDGYLLADDSGQPVSVEPTALGQALVAGGHAPFFVGLNLWHSAARLAPLLLAEGVLASLGFQDSFDDALAEYFFETLYRRLGGSAWQLPQSFAEAWAELRRQADLLPGTGIALWARAPLVPMQAVAAPAEPAPPRTPPEPAGAPAPAPAWSGACPIEWDIRPRGEISYAELHNGGSLFERFELKRVQGAPAPQLRIEVELHAGLESARYERELRLAEPRLPLAVAVPLTATVMRTVSEALNSSLRVRLTVDGGVVHAETHAVRLLPVDQWRDNLRSGKWLPSFVLPRDPAVERAVSAAQRYVRVIRDDPSAGFEGYQGADPGNPGTLDAVDLQVEAIWAALLHEWQLGYVNPPPSYSADLDSQRLRTPSAIHATRMGTCIDLALLFAACLELVDIYPVVFLLQGHALPGYWRHDSFKREFVYPQGAPRAAAVAAAAKGDSPDAVRVMRAAWWTVDHRSIWPLIRAGRLVPLETVRLTETCGFREAREAGIEALRHPEDFDSVLDIAIARENRVTPLPILGSGA